jgi:hypothetical protein
MATLVLSGSQAPGFLVTEIRHAVFTEACQIWVTTVHTRICSGKKANQKGVQKALLLLLV